MVWGLTETDAYFLKMISIFFTVNKFWWTVKYLLVFSSVLSQNFCQILTSIIFNKLNYIICNGFKTLERKKITNKSWNWTFEVENRWDYDFPLLFIFSGMNKAKFQIQELNFFHHFSRRKKKTWNKYFEINSMQMKLRPFLLNWDKVWEFMNLNNVKNNLPTPFLLNIFSKYSCNFPRMRF